MSDNSSYDNVSIGQGLSDKGKQRAFIIHPQEKSLKKEKQLVVKDPEYQLEEAKGLALAIDLNIIEAEIIWLSRIVPATFIGKGKVEELAKIIKEQDVDLVIINTSISPIQQRNLENGLKCKVIDRTALILEIFGERARTKEGKLQVELAAYEYQKSRLVRSWTHLERQRGGGGFLGGPGETQIEADRRQIAERIASIKKQLEKVVKTRELHRQSRRKVPYPIVSLVGYTNAGKSTLFNRLTGADVLAEDKLFATLDPTMRLITLPSGRKVMLSDTVGFISDLPTELVAAFRATLEEVIEADVILHVRDMADNEFEIHERDVLDILKSLGLERAIHEQMIEVLNKADLITPDNDDALHLLGSAKRKANCAIISALTGQDIDYLLDLIDHMLSHHQLRLTVLCPYEDGKMLAWLHEKAHIIECQDQEDGKLFTILLDPKYKMKVSKFIMS